jgi:hypothetical protein
VLGEELDAIEVTDRGLLGDRTYALAACELVRWIACRSR